MTSIYNLIYPIKNIYRYRQFYILFVILIALICLMSTVVFTLRTSYTEAILKLEKTTDSVYIINPRVEMAETLSYIMIFFIISITVYMSWASLLRHKKDIGALRAMGQSKPGIIAGFISEIFLVTFLSIITGIIPALFLYTPIIGFADKEFSAIIMEANLHLSFKFGVTLEIIIIYMLTLFVSSIIFTIYILSYSTRKILKQ